MKNLRRLCAGLVLTLALSANAFSGQVNCPGITPPPPRVAGPTLTAEITETAILVILGLIK